ncbi:MAG TPA: radical SAM protein [Candidatus Margulisiibacteriota bacterium]|nr:radical SAM protein [Candidatus Margulisiibacteriota bacterium]
MTVNAYPGYLEKYKSGELAKTADELYKMLGRCSICPRACKVNRLNNELGYCKTGIKPKVFSYIAHRGEEPPISGINGSGTIFFSNCNMRCVYCQNYEFSQIGQGREVDFAELAKIMLTLQEEGCHNINFVSPTHCLPQILKGLLLAIPQGLNIPLVYNTGGYELAQIIKRLEGIVDIYLPDMRYGEAESARLYSDAPDYPEYNRLAVKEMHRQVGLANIDKEGIINKGLIIRHLVLPNDVSGTKKVMQFIADELSTKTYISLMSQYLPYYQASQFKDISRRLTEKEYQAAEEAMEENGLSNGWIQESYGLERFAGIHIKPSLKKDG